mmetsp:Transcript_2914/g.8880  ORF Transcript_2914/g.8880 Transcript_2914/m.8880 type:complete len:263 (-) Transcript_2914:355-1143(-)
MQFTTRDALRRSAEKWHESGKGLRNNRARLLLHLARIQDDDWLVRVNVGLRHDVKNVGVGTLNAVEVAGARQAVGPKVREEEPVTNSEAREHNVLEDAVHGVACGSKDVGAVHLRLIAAFLSVVRERVVEEPSAGASSIVEHSIEAAIEAVRNNVVNQRSALRVSAHAVRVNDAGEVHGCFAKVAAWLGDDLALGIRAVRAKVLLEGLVDGLGDVAKHAQHTAVGVKAADEAAAEVNKAHLVAELGPDVEDLARLRNGKRVG